MKRKPVVFIEHVLESIELIEKYMKDINKEDFNGNSFLQDSVVRRIEIIGEAVKNVPNNFREKYPKVPWTDIAATRDKIIHHYFGVDLNTIWEIIKKDIPNLKKQMKDILKNHENVNGKIM